MKAELLFYIGGLALLDTLSPTLIGVTLYLMIEDNRRFGSRLMIYVATVMFLYFVLGCLLMVGLDLVQAIFTSFFQHKVVSWALLIVGGVLFTGSFWVKPKTGGRKKYHFPRSTGFRGLLIMGVSTFLLEAGTALPYYTAVSLMATEEMPITGWLLILTGYNLIMITPPLLIYVLHTWLDSRVQGIVEKLHRKLEEQSGSVLSWMMCIAGLILIFNVLDYI